MAPKESSALMRFIEMANQSPILESAMPEPVAPPPPIPIRPSRAETTVITGPFSRPQRRRSKLGAYLACAVGLTVLGVGLGSYLSGRADRASASAKAVTPAAAPAAAADPGDKKPEPTAPVAVPTDTEANAEPAAEPVAEPVAEPAAAAADEAVADAPPAPATETETPAEPAAAAASAPAATKTISKATGMFLSEPPGAVVTVFADGKAVTSLKAPAKIELDPAKTYAATFAKEGYSPMTKPVALQGESVRVVAVMEKLGAAKPVVAAKPKVAAEPDNTAEPEAEPAAVPTRRRFTRRDREAKAKAKTRATRRSRIAERRAKRRAARAERRRKARERRSKPTKTAKAPAAGTGMLMVGAKPPCRIYVAGRFRGITPARAISLPEGRHRLVLVNREHKIRASGTVVIKAGRTTRVIRDLTSRMK